MLPLNKPQDFYNSVLWTDKAKVGMFVHNAQRHFWQKPNIAHQHKQIVSPIKHGGRQVMTGSSHRVDDEVFSEVVCLTARTRLRSGDATGQQPYLKQQIKNRMSVKINK